MTSRQSRSLTRPPLDPIDRLLALYCRHFHPNVPIIHLPTFDINSTPAVLLISMLSIGALHHPQPFHAQFGAALLEIVRRMLGAQFAKDHRLVRSIPYVSFSSSPSALIDRRCGLTPASLSGSFRLKCFGLSCAGQAAPSELTIDALVRRKAHQGSLRPPQEHGNESSVSLHGVRVVEATRRL